MGSRPSSSSDPISFIVPFYRPQKSLIYKVYKCNGDKFVIYTWVDIIYNYIVMHYLISQILRILCRFLENLALLPCLCLHGQGQLFSAKN